MRVLIPSPLRSYTQGRSEVEAAGATLAQVLDDLERQFPGIRFRMIDEQGGIRPHIRFFVNQELAERLDTPVSASEPVHVICALSGGLRGRSGLSASMC